jgi:hypothetical protein
MKRRMIGVLVCAGLVLAGSAAAQPDKGRDWTGNIAIGWSGVQGDAGDVLGDDLIINGGAVYKPSDWPVGLFFDGAWSNYDIKSSLLDAAGLEGDVLNFSISTGLLWSRPISGNVGFYLQGGFSGYYLDAEVTEDTTVVVCDPWWWWCYPAAGEYVWQSKDTTEWGYNAGIGISFDLASDSQFYVEGRYHWIETDRSVEYTPIVIGFRW